MLFQGFPRSLSWSLRLIEELDLLKIKMINYQEWTTYAGGTRNFDDFARRIVADDPAISDLPTTKAIRAISKRLEAGGSVPAVIAVTSEDEAAIVMVEGHARTTARFMINRIVGTEIIVGSASSVELQGWFVY